MSDRPDIPQDSVKGENVQHDEVRGTITVEHHMEDIFGPWLSSTITLPFRVLSSEPASQGKIVCTIEIDGNGL